MAENAVSQVLNSLSPRIYEATIVCPLCGSAAPASGLRQRPVEEMAEAPWQVLFACSACGLLTPFNVKNLSVRQVQALKGSNWATELRHFQHDIRRGQLRYKRRATTRHFVGVFLVSFVTWMALIGNFNPGEVLWGLATSLLIARFTFRFLLFDFWSWMSSPSRWLQLGRLVFEFNRQIIVQNLHLALRVFRRDMGIRPGIVVVPTKLRSEVQLTMLGSLMSLTPDTVTLDIDEKQGLIYVHWIEVQTTDPQEARKLISESLEEKIIGWLG
jgi:multicomponent Na+:H+ antiporter subunit E